jgi:hypothetical protein
LRGSYTPPSALTLTRPRIATEDAQGNPVAPFESPLERVISYRNSVANNPPEKMGFWKRLGLGALMGLGGGGNLAQMLGGAIGGAAVSGAMPTLIPKMRQRQEVAQADEEIDRERGLQRAGLQDELLGEQVNQLRRKPQVEAAEAQAEQIKRDEDRLLQIYKDGDYDPGGTDERSRAISENLRRLQGMGSTLNLPARKGSERAPIRVEKLGVHFIQQPNGWLNTSTGEVVDRLPVDLSDVPVMEDGLHVKPGSALSARATRGNQLTQDARTEAEINQSNQVLDSQIAELRAVRERLQASIPKGRAQQVVGGSAATMLEDAVPGRTVPGGVMLDPDTNTLVHSTIVDDEGQEKPNPRYKELQGIEKERLSNLEQIDNQIRTLERQKKPSLAPRVSPQSSKVASRQDVEEYARKKNIPYEQAVKDAERDGYTVR